MVLGIMVISAIPTVTGVSQAISEQKKQEEAVGDERYMTKFNLDVFCEPNNPKARQVHGSTVVLRDNKLFVWPKDPQTGQAQQIDPDSRPPHRFTGFYIQYPDEDRPPTRGLVSTISVDPPMLNWIYADATTREFRYGNRSQSIQHIVGPWDWTEDEEGVTIDGEEAIVAVEEEAGVWALYYDKDKNHIAGVPGVKGKTILEVSLERNILEEERQGKDKGMVKQEGNMSTKWDK